MKSVQHASLKFRLTGCSERWLFANCESIACARHVQNHSYTSQNPLSRWILCLELGRENVGHHTVDCLVNRALINGLVFFVGKHNSLAVNYWHNRETSLRERLFQTSVDVPTSTFNLETKYIGTFTALWQVSLVEHLLKDVSLNDGLVEFLVLVTTIDLLDSSKERLWVDQPVNEGNFRQL